MDKFIVNGKEVVLDEYEQELEDNFEPHVPVDDPAGEKAMILEAAKKYANRL
jgi:hypothetical protein